MKKGFTTIELIITLAVLSILLVIVTSSVDTIKSRARSSEARANMDAIAQAGYTDYSYNGDWAPMPALVGTMPDRFVTEGLLSRWPRGMCPGWYYSWENIGAVATYIRVSLRDADDAALWSYCVSTFGGADCQPIDPVSGTIPIEISTIHLKHLYCDGTAD